MRMLKSPQSLSSQSVAHRTSLLHRVFTMEYYVYPTKPRGVCFIISLAVKDFSRLPTTEKTFPPIRLFPLVDLRVSLCKSGAYLFLFAENKVEYVLNLTATTTIYDDDGERLYREVRECMELGWKTDILPSFDCVLPETLPNDSLNLDIRLDIFNLNYCEAAWERETQGKFLEDLKNWIFEELPEEVILKTKDDFIQVNKAILCARSEVFRRMFQHPMRERTSNIVPIDDVDGAALKTLVEFILSGKTEFPNNTEIQAVEELYYAADKYDVRDLREICAQIMLSMLSKENALGVLVMADRHSDHHLRNECVAFIHCSCIQEVMETESWEHLKAHYPYLAVDVLDTWLKGNATISSGSPQLVGRGSGVARNYFWGVHEDIEMKEKN